MRHARASCKSNKDRITDEWEEFELRFPGWICFDEVVEFDVDDLDWSEPAAGSFSSVLAVDFAKQCVARIGEFVVIWMQVADQQQFVMRWL